MQDFDIFDLKDNLLFSIIPRLLQQIISNVFGSSLVVVYLELIS